jgi:hypothetical protein
MSGTKNPADLVNIRYQVSSTDTAIENGNVVLIGAIDSSNRDVFIGGTPARDSDFDSIALIVSPEVVADESVKDLNGFRNAAGAISRGYRPRKGDIFSVTAEAVTPIDGTAPAANQVVELQAATKLKLVASSTSGSTQIGKVIAIEGSYIVILVS